MGSLPLKMRVWKRDDCIVVYISRFVHFLGCIDDLRDSDATLFSTGAYTCSLFGLFAFACAAVHTSSAQVASACLELLTRFIRQVLVVAGCRIYAVAA
ncbi:hypothetical protein U1Q18_024456 [Sarracenia purpurea var. burkii]